MSLAPCPLGEGNLRSQPRRQARGVHSGVPQAATGLGSHRGRAPGRGAYGGDLDELANLGSNLPLSLRSKLRIHREREDFGRRLFAYRETPLGVTQGRVSFLEVKRDGVVDSRADVGV